MSESQFESYYQFCPKLDYPIFVRFNCAMVESTFSKVLHSMNFDIVEKTKLASFSAIKGYRVLTINESSLMTSKQITDYSVVMRSYGSEIVSDQATHSLYVQANTSLMIFHNDYPQWSCAVIDGEMNSMKMNMLLTRYLSFSLLEFGVMGFWGQAIEEGFVCMKPKQSKGKSIFIDLKKYKLICSDGIKPIKSLFKIFRLESTLRNESRSLSTEELASFLMTNNSYLSFNGVHIKLRDLIFNLSSKSTGIVYPEDLFESKDSSSRL